MDPTLKAILAQTSLLASRVRALEGLLSRGLFDIGTIADPAPDGGGWGGHHHHDWGHQHWHIPDIPIHWDPSPEELSKLSRVQIESRIADIANLRRKLDGVEQLLNEAMERQR